jgi:hypothetical protein
MIKVRTFINSERCTKERDRLVGRTLMIEQDLICLEPQCNFETGIELISLIFLVPVTFGQVVHACISTKLNFCSCPFSFDMLLRSSRN